ncbi:MAG: phosphomethylpyrimidine synthase ThiC, partial [Phycisphaerae bacterium]|nr:phosphomethylpyrimidine synthase ThiC [Phycisphaerae bacterium]
MTQLEAARDGKITDEMRKVAQTENLEPETIRSGICDGHIVIIQNTGRNIGHPCGIGKGLRTKVNANLGTSPDYADVEVELEKLRAAEEAGADAIMDLSTGGDITEIRKIILERASVPVGTVPIYEAGVGAAKKRGAIVRMTAGDMLGAVRNHARDGVDFATVHCGVTRDVIKQLEARPRLCGMVSRGGTFLAEWMRHTGQENPLFEKFDELLDILREFDVTLSLGDGLRPGAIADAFDAAQIGELNVMADLAVRARAAGVQVMIEGPGHVPLDQVAAQVKLQKALTGGAPFYVLGPIVTDVAPGYDHITSAIGGAVAGMAGADFLCYVTPTEHLSLPRPEDVRLGVMAARIAAHAADVAKGLPGARDW